MKMRFMCAVLAAALIAGCAGCSGADDQAYRVETTTVADEIVSVPKPAIDVPDLYLVYSSCTGEHRIRATSGGYSWGLRASDCWVSLFNTEHMTTIMRTPGFDSVKLEFTVPPSSYEVKRWPDKYISGVWTGDFWEALEGYEMVDVSDGVITSPHDVRYVYEVSAEWKPELIYDHDERVAYYKVFERLPGGGARYRFYVK
ncbi:MAG: hypothetical protein FWF05_08345 [Oscillospiraceae bacterium]|nr:hypothetical protein [Oscillospiraceae bacterium]